MVASTVPLTPEQLKDRLIEDGLRSIEQDPRFIDATHKLEGSREGFELCRTLDTPEDFQRILAERCRESNTLITKKQQGRATVDDYWKHRFATVQIEFVWERMKVVWKLPGPWSTIAVVHIGTLLGYSDEPPPQKRSKP